MFRTASLIIFTAMIAVTQVRAGEAGELFGSPVVLDSGLIMLDGHQVALWGIETLADDQQCWQEDRAWDCGEQAATALKHFVQGQLVKCQVKGELGDSGISAQCFRVRGDKVSDIARYLVVHGWAMDEEGCSGGMYALDQERARRERRGIWTSRFQTAADWREGVQRFVEYELEPEPVIMPRIVNETTVNNATTNIIIMGPHKKGGLDIPHYPRRHEAGFEQTLPPVRSEPAEASPPEPAPEPPAVPGSLKPVGEKTIVPLEGAAPKSKMSEKERTSEIILDTATPPKNINLLPTK